MRANREPTYAVQLMRPFWNVLRRYPQISGEMLDEAEKQDPEQRFPIAAAQELLRGAVAITGDEDLGLKAARETAVGDFEVLEYAAASAATWRDGLETLLRYCRLMNEAADFRMEMAGDRVNVVLNSTIPLSRVATDFQSAAFHVAISRWIGADALRVEVHFSHAEPADTAEYRATFGDNRIVFGAAWDGFVVDAATLDTALQSANPSLHRVLRSHADRLMSELAPGNSLVERVRAHILSTLQEGRASATHTASHLHMSRRTLTRQLRQEGTSFTALLEDVRRRSAIRYLQSTDYSVEDIAFLLGFAESPPFIRAFRRWMGKPPHEYRRTFRRG